MIQSSELPVVLHKVNSFITVIYGYAQLIETKGTDPAQVAKWNKKIVESCEQFREYIDALNLNYGEAETDEKERDDTNESNDEGVE